MSGGKVASSFSSSLGVDCERQVDVVRVLGSQGISKTCFHIRHDRGQLRK